MRLSSIEKVAIVVLGGLAGSCIRQENQQVSAEIQTIDSDHFIINPQDTDGNQGISPIEFGTSLAKFRKEHPGDFVLIPSNARSVPSSHSILMVRKEITSEKGTNSLELTEGFGASDDKD